MANEYTENLKKGKKTQFKSGENAAESGRKGGRKSQEVQKEKRTIQCILNEMCEQDISDNPKMESLAKALGIKAKSVKELVTAAAMINTVCNADLKSLAMLGELLGEATSKDDGVMKKLDKVIGEIDVIADK